MLHHPFYNDKYRKTYSLDLAMRNGASCPESSLSMRRYHFDLTKGEFWDGIVGKCGWDPVKLTSEICNVAQAPLCTQGHTDIRYFANQLNEACDDTETGSCLQTLQIELQQLEPTLDYISKLMAFSIQVLAEVCLMWKCFQSACKKFFRKHAEILQISLIHQEVELRAKDNSRRENSILCLRGARSVPLRFAVEPLIGIFVE